jgi:hypothetical protein
MASIWKRIFSDEKKELQVADSGDNYYSLLKIEGEVIMAIVQPPSTFAGGYNIGAGVSVYDAAGNVQVGKNKDIEFGKPIVLFNENNRAGLKLVDVLAETKAGLAEALKNEDTKIDVDNINENNVIPFKKEQSIAIGSSVLQMNKNETISIVRTPNIVEEDKQFLRLTLQFVVKSLLGKEGIYRANIMLLDPTSNKLKIEAHYNMDGYQDINIQLRPDEGCAGKALQEDSIRRVDLIVQTHAEYHVPSQTIWSEMKSIYSLPIHDTKGNILGLLNADTNQSLYDTRFVRDNDFDYCMRLASDVMGKYLEKKI